MTLPGDAHGRDEMMSSLALLTKNFTPMGANVESRIGYGDIFTLNGQTLYFGSALKNIGVVEIFEEALKLLILRANG